MRKILVFATIVSLIFTACNSTNSQKELELKEKELQLKERELSLQEKEKATQGKPDSAITNFPNTTVEKKSVDVQDNGKLIEKLIGCWFVPHAAIINIKFYRNSTFEFNDYNSKLDRDELLTGKFEINGQSLALLYNDRPKQTFKFYKGEGADDNYYIRSKEYYFVKGECESMRSGKNSDTTSIN